MLDSLSKKVTSQVSVTLLKGDFSAGVFLRICEIFVNTFSMEHPMWLLLVLYVYLDQIINLNTKVLKVLQVSWLGIIMYVKCRIFLRLSIPMHAYTK